MLMVMMVIKIITFNVAGYLVWVAHAIVFVITEKSNRGMLRRP